MHTTLYEQLGGHQAIERIVDDFYRRVLADDAVNDFAHTNMAKQDINTVLRQYPL